MRRARDDRHIRLLRGVFGIAFLLLVAYIGRLFLRQDDDGQAANRGPAARQSAEDLPVRGETFEADLWRDGEIVFQVKGDQRSVNNEGEVVIVPVQIVARRPDGEYLITAERGSFDQQRTGNARLEGQVKVEGPDGMLVETDWLRLEDQVDRLFAQDGVTFRLGEGLEGNAMSMRANLARNSIVLEQGVKLRGTSKGGAEIELDARRVDFDQTTFIARADGNVTIRNGADELRARSLQLHLDPETRDVRLLNLRRDVRGQLSTIFDGDNAAPVFVRGERLSLGFAPPKGDADGDPELERLELAGDRQRPAVLRQPLAGGAIRSLATQVLHGELSGGRMLRARLDGQVRLVDQPPGGKAEQREARSLDGEARFRPDGELEGLTLLRQVRIRAERLEATGDRSYIDFGRDRVELYGDPVVATHPKGTLEAPELVYYQVTDLVHASGGVSATLKESGEGALRVAGGSGEVQVRSRETYWSSDPQRVVFEGDVRAWQGEQTLLAAELRGNSGTGTMTATGNVRTLWPGQPKAGDGEPEPAGADTDGDGDEAARRMGSTFPAEVRADDLLYEESSGTITYRGNVVARQEQSVISCRELAVQLDEADEPESMICTGDVQIDDQATGRVLRGDRADYDPTSRIVAIIGRPLRMTDATGAEVEGSGRFVYNLEDGTLRMEALAADMPSAAASGEGGDGS